MPEVGPFSLFFPQKNGKKMGPKEARSRSVSTQGTSGGKKAVPLCFFRNNFLNNRYFSLQFNLDVNNTAIHTI